MSAECQQCLEYEALISALHAEQPMIPAWLCRDPMGVQREGAHYVLKTGDVKPEKVECQKGRAPWFWSRLSAHDIEPEVWERVGGIALAPAGGPVRVTVGVRCERQPTSTTGA